ncbi:MAG: hypothetical protein WA761_05815 [Thermoplasmata archaeon]
MASATVRVIFNFTIAAPAQAIVGHTLTIQLRADGGYGDLVYNYSGLPPGCESRDTADLTCTPTQAGTYDVFVTVHDEVGNSATRDVDVEVIAPTPYAGLIADLGGPFGISVILAIAVATIAGLAVYRYRRPSSRSPGAEVEGPDPYQEYRLPHPIGLSRPNDVSELESEDDPFRGVT